MTRVPHEPEDAPLDRQSSQLPPTHGKLQTPFILEPQSRAMPAKWLQLSPPGRHRRMTNALSAKHVVQVVQAVASHGSCSAPICHQ